MTQYRFSQLILIAVSSRKIWDLDKEIGEILSLFLSFLARETRVFILESDVLASCSFDFQGERGPRDAQRGGRAREATRATTQAQLTDCAPTAAPFDRHRVQ